MGTRISVAIWFLLCRSVSWGSCEVPGIRRARRRGKRCELRQMLRHHAGRRARRRPAGRCSAHALVLGVDMSEHPFQIGVDEGPGAHVLRLFLAPHHLGAAEAAELADQRLGRERIELLDAQQIDVVDAALLALLVEVVIDLARAHDDAADLRSSSTSLIAWSRRATAASSHNRRWKGRCSARDLGERRHGPLCGAAATSASSGSAACGSRA